MKFSIAFILLFTALAAEKSQMERDFTRISQDNTWSSWPETVSGEGSMIKYTNNVREQLPKLFAAYNIKSVLDLPCGDFNWMKEIDFDEMTYNGADIVRHIIKENQEKYATDNINFHHLDATTAIPEKHDLIICRDLLIHLSNKNILKVLNNLKASGSKYFLISTAPEAGSNDSKDAAFRPIDISLPIYGMGPPILLIYDDYATRHIGLWKNDTL
jgi:2-polyprenyl-3-methyl-5-hydroxy-6-metoxy-1,4-benzoquinol methylase